MFYIYIYVNTSRLYIYVYVHVPKDLRNKYYPFKVKVRLLSSTIDQTALYAAAGVLEYLVEVEW